jgi:hypothetical protein
MISIDPIRPYLPLIKAGLLAVLIAAVWGHGCSYGRKGLAEVKAKHAATLEGLATATEAQARRAKEVEEGVRLMRREAEKTYQKGIEDAYIRGAATAADIASGKLPVGGVWRDQCPKAPAGQGPGPNGGSTGVSADRAAAIGRVLGIAGEADATDALLRSRLQEAQKLLDACYEEPAR